MVMTEMSTNIIATLISLHCYLVTKNYYANDDKDIRNSKTAKRFVYLFLGFGLPFIGCFLLLHFEILGINQIWCWLREGIESIYQRNQKIYYIFIWFLIFLNLLFILLSFYANKTIHYRDNRYKNEFIKKLMYYPVLGLIAWLPATLDRVLYFIYDKKDYPEAFFEFINVIFFQLQGFTYALFFTMNNLPHVKIALNRFFKIFYKRAYNENLENGYFSESTLETM